MKHRLPWLLSALFVLLWIASWIALFMTGGLKSAPDHASFLGGEVVTAVIVGIGLFLARHIPVVAADNVAIRDAAAELIGSLAYFLAVLVTAHWFGLRTHIASIGLTEATMHVWHEETVRSILAWTAYFAVSCAVIPLVVLKLRGYHVSTMLLGFPHGARWIVYCIVAAVISVAGFAGRAFFELPPAAHVLAIGVFSLGTFLPVMVLIQSVIVPRLAIVTGSWISAAVLGGFVYGIYHSGEFFMDWSSGSWLLSASWFMQFSFFGVLKALTTLRTRSAWIHIFNTHMPHLAEAPALAEVFGLSK
jgi:hypothetical protein